MSARGVRTDFTSRWGGVGRAPYDSLNLGVEVGDDLVAVAANRSIVAEAAGVEAVVWMDQVHGDVVVVVDRPPLPGEAAPRCDGLVARLPGLALGVLVADCVPVLMTDPGSGVVAAVHAGRLGAQSDVVLQALDAMVSLGADPGRVQVVLGPAICGECYEVPEAMQRVVAAFLPASLSTTRWGTPGLDLRRGLQGRLAGRVGSVEIVDVCTFESLNHFSHRREGVTGRTAGVVRFSL